MIRWHHIALWVVFLAVMVAMPDILAALGFKKGVLRTLIWGCYIAVFAMSWDFLSGRTGYISFGHPFLIGLGAYTTAILSYRFGVPVALSIPAAVVVTVIGSIFFILPALRVRGSYFALVTLAFMELMYQLTQVVRPDLTGGTRGISGLETLTRGAVNGYYLAFTVMFCVAVILWCLNRTRLGTALSAIGQNEDAVAGSGLNPVKLKLFAFGVSAAVAGLGGAFLVHYQGSVAPRALFDINFVFTIIVAALIGGAGTILGPMAGAFFLVLLLEYLRPWLPGAERYLIYGGIALVIYMIQPKGIHAILGGLGMKLRGGNNAGAGIMTPLLELDSVFKRFGGLVATNNMSFGVNRGESVGLIGPNGAGKTTIFSLIMGEHRQNEGAIRFDGQDISRLPTHARIQRGISRTYQVPRPFAEMTVAENIRIGLTPDNLGQMLFRGADRNAEKDLALSVGFTDTDLDRLPSELSMGDLRKLELARTLATGAETILLDEVFAGLTTGEIAQITELVNARRAEGMTFVIVSHDLKALEPLVDRVIAMTQGTMIAEGPFAEVIANPDVRASYLGA